MFKQDRRNMQEYIKALGDLINQYEERSIYHSELYLFWKWCKQYKIDHIIESGTYKGFSTLRLEKLFPECLIETFERDRGFWEEANKRLIAADCYCGDIRDMHLELTPTTAVLIDGPKKERAIGFAKKIVNKVAFVAMHDMKKYLKRLKKEFKKFEHSGNPVEEVKALDKAIPYNPQHHKHGLYGNVLAIVRNR